jgi:hypothetical protein
VRVIRVAGRAPTPEELSQARRLAELARDTLPRTRESAEKWRNGVLGMIGIIAAVTILKGPASLSTVPSGWKVAVLCLAAGAVSAAIISLMLAMLASFGWPSPEQFTAVSRLAEWETGEVRRTVARLRWSMTAALVFVALFVGGLGVSALAPTTKPQIEVVRTDGTALCGDRMSVTTAAITLQTRGVDVVVPANQIGAVRAVAQCGS